MTKTRTRRFVKLTIGAELKTQLVTSIKVRRGPANDTRDFPPVVRRAHAIKRIKVGIGDKGYDSEKNHELLRDGLHAQSIIPARHEDVPIWRPRMITDDAYPELLIFEPQIDNFIDSKYFRVSVFHPGDYCVKALGVLRRNRERDCTRSRDCSSRSGCHEEAREICSRREVEHYRICGSIGTGRESKGRCSNTHRLTSRIMNYGEDHSYDCGIEWVHVC